MKLEDVGRHQCNKGIFSVGPKYSEDFDMSQTSHKEIQQSIQNDGLAFRLK